MYETILVDGLNVHYRNKGAKIDENKPVVLLIHGLVGSLNYWDFLFESDLCNHFNVFAVDLIGFGLSDKPSNFSYSMNDQVQLLSKFRSRLKIQVRYIVGFSMGGTIAVLLAPYVNQLSSLVLVEPVLFYEDCNICLYAKKAPACLLNFAKFFAFIFKRTTVKRFLNSKDKTSRKIILKAYYQSTTRSFKRSSVQLVQSVSESSIYKKLNDIKCKKYYFLGDTLEKDKRFKPPNELFTIAEKIVISKSKHIVPLDNPSEFNTKLLSILL